MIKKTDPRYPAFAAALHDYLHGYFSGIGCKGGRATSAAKSAASRANGAKGGRPRQRLCKRCRWIHDMRCPLTAWERELRLYRPSSRHGPTCDLYEDSSRAKPASLKQSRTGRCKPASSGSRPSKPKKRS